MVSPGGAGTLAAGGVAGGAVAVVAPGNSDSGIWWMSETDTTLEAPSAAVLIENTTYDLYLRTDQIIEPWSLQFVGNLRRYVGQQIMPVTPGMVLANNAMQG